ncbi:hypothetical protein ACH4PU_08950 [Streptomyces sp. NPDC021100]|uniref:hypothetical protein n=1 Tax=Streptomyces sp. NPDC021100 TaxID=3365114 RepID=UPI0037931A04
MHSGGGDQHIYYWSVGAEEGLTRRGAARLEIIHEHRRRLGRCFIRPRGYAEAADRLTRPGAVVLLEGAPGSGRRAAATVLLEEASVPGSRIEELPVNPEGSALDDAASGDCYLLDLSHMNDSQYAGAQRALMLYRSLARKSGARVVAVSPAGLEWMLDAELTPLAVQLGRPRARAVLSRHLRVRGVRFAHDQLSTDELAHLLATAPMRELDRLAQLVVQARDSARCGTEFEDWRDEALAAATNWSQQVARQLREHSGVRERALLLAAAMTHGAAPDAVVGAARGLVGVLRYPEDDTPRLAQEGLAEQFERLSLARESDGRVRFHRLAYDSAVRSYFWENFPELRQGFRDWVRQCVRLPELGSEDRAQLVGRFAEQALSSGRAEDIGLLVEKWTHSSAAGRLRAEAAAILELGLSHEEHGAHLRSRVYQWVTAARLMPDLARVLTDVCHHVMSVTHPEQAAVRLRHLALRPDTPDTTAQAARTALLELARGNRRLYRRLLSRLLHKVRMPDRCLDVLADLLKPNVLNFKPPWEEFTLAWRAVMTGRPPTAWAPIVCRWLTLIAQRQASPQVLDALLLGASADRTLLNQLYVTTCDWSGERPVTAGQGGPGEARERVADRFFREIDLAQGIRVGPLGGPARATWGGR